MSIFRIFNSGRCSLLDILKYFVWVLLIAYQVLPDRLHVDQRQSHSQHSHRGLLKLRKIEHRKRQIEYTWAQIKNIEIIRQILWANWVGGYGGCFQALVLQTCRGLHMCWLPENRYIIRIKIGLLWRPMTVYAFLHTKLPWASLKATEDDAVRQCFPPLRSGQSRQF